MLSGLSKVGSIAMTQPTGATHPCSESHVISIGTSLITHWYSHEFGRAAALTRAGGAICLVLIFLRSFCRIMMRIRKVREQLQHFARHSCSILKGAALFAAGNAGTRF